MDSGFLSRRYVFGLHLYDSDKSWRFVIDISKDLKVALMDEYTNEKKPDDGEFYYKIRQFCIAGLLAFETVSFELAT